MKYVGSTFNRNKEKEKEKKKSGTYQLGYFSHLGQPCSMMGASHTWVRVAEP